MISVRTFLTSLVIACAPNGMAAPVKIMPLGDSITAGYTDNPTWNVPFEFGYRSNLHNLLTDAGYDFQFTGGSLEPFNNAFGDPTRGGTVSPVLDLRPIGQNGHRGYGGVNITTTNSNVTSYLNSDTPDIILLMIGINGISASSPGQLDTLVNTIVTARPAAQLIVAQITPRIDYNADLFNYNTYIRNTLVPKYVGLGKKVSTVDQYKNFLTNPADPTSINRSLFSNGINHPSNPAYNTMAATWFAGIQAVAPAALPVLDATGFLSSITPGASIGTITHTSSLPNENYTYSLVPGAGDMDNSRFSISGDQLLAGSYDYDLDDDGKSYAIRVRATGNLSGKTGEQSFSLTLARDSDEDRIADAWEMAKAGSLTSLTASGDFDGDQLADVAEYALSKGVYPNIDPTRRDTDDDGLADGAETNGAGMRPPTDPTVADTDQDHISDLAEDNGGIYQSLLRTGTNPTVGDSDGDGPGDGQEILDGTNPLAPTSPPPVTNAGISSSNELIHAGDVSNSDLLQAAGASAVHSGWNTTNSASPTKLNDGIHGGSNVPVEGGWAQSSGSVSTFTLPPGMGNGWDLSGITSIAAWLNAGFGNQRYSVSIRRVGETAFTSLATVNYQKFTVDAGGASKVQINRSNGFLARSVAAVRFTMLTTNGNGGRAVYREIDVFGTETPAARTAVLAIQSPTTDLAKISIIWLSRPLKTYRVEMSGNLQSWTQLSAALPSGGITTTLRHDANPSTESRAFFRVSENP